MPFEASPHFNGAAMGDDKETEEIFATIDNFSIDDLTVTGMSVRSGTKVLKLAVVETRDHSDVISDIKEEYKSKLRAVTLKIKDQINSKLNELRFAAIQAKQEYEKKEEALQKRLSKSNVMPEIHEADAHKVAVVRGNDNGYVTWVVRGIYCPKFVDGKRIDPTWGKRLVFPILIYITADNSGRVVSVSTRNIANGRYFSHYHQNNPDCWGRWHYNGKTLKTPQDALAIAAEAQGVLENINTGSIASRRPGGLPSLQVVENHIEEKPTPDTVKRTDKIEKTIIEREGGAVEEDLAWTT